MNAAGSILVIDDEPEVAEVLRDCFQERGYSVTCATNGREALALVSRSRPDAVVLDVQMPDRDGLAVLSDLLALDRSLTVVMLSGADDEALARTLLEAGAFDYVCKPFMLDNLQQVIALAVLVGKRKAIGPDETTPWQCETRGSVDEATPLAGDGACERCHERVREGDTTAVRARDGRYLAACWLGRAADSTGRLLQLAPR
jgi:two-component system repressor protein LuxO